jgi:hypothetical protein
VRIENHPEFSELTPHDQNELRKFETYLKAHYAAKRGEAVDAPELLYASVYGQPEGALSPEEAEKLLQSVVPDPPGND